jgi:ribonuclease P protein component
LEFLGEQADVPAEQPAAGKDAWVPAADANPRGSLDPGGTSRQGSLAAVGLTTTAVMLPAAARLRRRAEFTATVRAGRRSSVPALVVHLEAKPDGRVPPSPQVGFVVTRALGGAVERNRLRRVLRHLVRDRLAALPPGSRTVIRANPAAAGLSTAALAEQLDRALDRAKDRAEDRVLPRAGSSGAATS